MGQEHQFGKRSGGSFIENSARLVMGILGISRKKPI